MQIDVDRFRAPFVGQPKMDAGIQERQLAEPVLKGGQIVIRHREGFFRRVERDLGAGQRLAVFHNWRRPDHF